MKKLLALLLALAMALSCVGAFAEETESKETAFAIPSFSVTFESTADVEALAALLPMFGADESTMTIMQAILPLLAETNGQLVFADNGLQLDLGLKGQNILTVAAEQTEGGFALASDILPSYVLTLSTETIEEIFKQFTAQTEEAFANVNFEALMENLTGYITQYIAACTGAVTFGEPEMGEYAFEDLELTFNCMAPITVDTEAIKAAVETLTEQLKNDESLSGLINAMGAMGLPADTSEQTAVIFPDQVNAAVYTNVDEEGNAVGDATLVVVETATTVEEQTVAVNVVVVVEGQSVSVAVTMPDQDITVSVALMPTDDGAAMNCMFQGMGLTAAENVVFSMGETIQVYTEYFLMDLEKAIATELVNFAMGGERTFAVMDENKTAVSVEQLMADTEGQISAALLSDIMSNGLGTLIAKVSEIMPNEVAALMAMFMPAEAVEAPAE